MLMHQFYFLDLTVTTPSVIPTLYVRLNKTIDDDKVFRIECIVKSSPRANVSFTRLGETLIASDENGIELKTRKDGDSVTYIMTLEKITHRQAGEYFCRAQNGVYKKNVVVGVVELAGLFLDCLGGINFEVSIRLSEG